MGDYEYKAIVKQLKKFLKAKGITYKELGKKLGMTEGGIKKILGGDDYSIGRFTRICDAAEVSRPSIVSGGKAECISGRLRSTISCSWPRASFTSKPPGSMAGIPHDPLREDPQ